MPTLGSREARLGALDALCEHFSSASPDLRPPPARVGGVGAHRKKGASARANSTLSPRCIMPFGYGRALCSGTAPMVARPHGSPRFSAHDQALAAVSGRNGTIIYCSTPVSETAARSCRPMSAHATRAASANGRAAAACSASSSPRAAVVLPLDADPVPLPSPTTEQPSPSACAFFSQLGHLRRPVSPERRGTEQLAHLGPFEREGVGACSPRAPIARRRADLSPAAARPAASPPPSLRVGGPSSGVAPAAARAAGSPREGASEGAWEGGREGTRPSAAADVHPPRPSHSPIVLRPLTRPRPPESAPRYRIRAVAEAEATDASAAPASSAAAGALASATVSGPPLSAVGTTPTRAPADGPCACASSAAACASSAAAEGRSAAAPTGAAPIASMALETAGKATSEGGARGEATHLAAASGDRGTDSAAPPAVAAAQPTLVGGVHSSCTDGHGCREQPAGAAAPGSRKESGSALRESDVRGSAGLAPARLDLEMAAEDGGSEEWDEGRPAAGPLRAAPQRAASSGTTGSAPMAMSTVPTERALPRWTTSPSALARGHAKGALTATPSRRGRRVSTREVILPREVQMTASRPNPPTHAAASHTAPPNATHAPLGPGRDARAADGAFRPAGDHRRPAEGALVP